MLKKNKIFSVLLSLVLLFTSGVSKVYANNDTKSTGIITASRLNVRTGASTRYRVITTVSRNTKVEIQESKYGWHKIKLPNNKIGWSSGKYIKKTTNSNNNSSNNKPSNNNQTNSKTVTVEASAYTGYNITSTGEKPVWGSIAVDPKVIPYGTKVYIPYFDKVFVANNCGGAIKGNKIDIFMNTRKQCYDWGRRDIEIQILGK